MVTEKKYTIAGDIGGTKTLLGLFAIEEGRIRFVQTKRYPSKDYTKLSDIIDLFLKESDVQVNRESACFGIAGPCEGGVCTTVNLPWVIDAREINAKFGIERVSLINDFEAIVYGVPQLDEDELEVINKGIKDPRGNIAVLGAGTGLGEAFAVYENHSNRYRVYPSEGGHASFSPNNDEEIGLLKFLQGEHGHVSFERVLSGNGLVNIYRYLASSGSYGVSGEVEKEIKSGLNPAGTISRLAMVGKSDICSKSLDLFASIYGSEAGNLALKILPMGGVYLAGGIAAKIKDKLMDGLFLKAFLNKGRSSELLKNIPVRIVLNPEVGLIGAAVKASE
jgi:glucokinase